MPEIILHHYETSPFGRIIRLCLAHKGVTWKSVDQPIICPKPELSALTGGYERIPVLQIGSDIYCDTALIAQVLETHTPEPTLYPQPLGLAGRIIAAWSGNLWFMPAVAVALGTDPNIVDEDFWADRAGRFGMTQEGFLPMVPHLTGQFDGGAELVRDALADGRRFLAGDAPGHADFALFANIVFVGWAGRTPADFGPDIAAWSERIEAIGEGDCEQWSREQAIAHAAETDASGDYAVDESVGFAKGQTVSVTTESPDPAAVTGKLIGLDHRHIVLAREDGQAGRVHVHLPRIGQVIAPA